MTWRLIHADCLEAMREMDESSVDAIVTDPPYGLEFMGKEWDSLNVAKHGNAAMMPNGERNYRHDGRENVGGRLSRTAAPPTPKKNPRCRKCDRLKTDKEASRCKCEHPDWDTRTREFGWQMQEWHHAWAAEALRVLKPGGHLLAFGGTRTYHRLACALEDAGFEIRDCLAWMYGSGFPKSLNLTGDWQGWGTALKPAFEPIVLARKPLVGTVASNVMTFGTGALNIDGTRIEHASDNDLAESQAKNPGRGDTVTSGVYGAGRPQQSVNTSGRWPPNVILDREAAAMLDEQSGESVSRIGKPRSGPNGDGWGMTSTGAEYADTGGASRFYYVPKADSAERNRGLEHRAATNVNDGRATSIDNAYQRGDTLRHNTHPTVKPVALMQWLCRLVTPPAGVVLDPFTGSGSTGIAALREGFSFIGIEREAEYVEIARDRIIGDAPLLNTPAEVVA